MEGLWTETQHSGATVSVHKLAKKKKKNETNNSPVWTEQASSIKVLLLIMLYFEFPDSIASWSVNTTVNKKMQNHPVE